jgi:transposase
MVSAVSAKGLLRFQIVDGTMTAPKFKAFCQRLLADAGQPVVLIVDGHSTHKAKLVKDWVASTDGRFTLRVLPAYSPQLNPDEWVWNNVKNHRVGRAAVAGPDHLRSLAIGALRRLQKLPGVVRGFFGDPSLAYIAAADAAA